MMASPANLLKRTFLFEFNDYADWDATELTNAINTAHAAGVRTVGTSKDSPVTATVDNHLDVFHTGFDVVYTYNLENAVTARQIVNTDNGISPP